MKKRISAAIIAVIMSTAFILNSYAEEMFIAGQEEAWSGDNSVEIIEIDELDTTDECVYEENLQDDTDPAQEDLVFDIEALEEVHISLADESMEEAEDSEDASVEMVDETIEGVLSPSGLAAEASLNMGRTMGYFPGNYGDQLSGTAKMVYNSLVASYVTRGETGRVDLTFSTPFTFHVQGTVDEFKQLKWDKENNFDFQFTDEQIDFALQAAYDAFQYDHPEVFWMGSVYYGYNISYSPSGMGQGSYTGKVASAWMMPYEAYSGSIREKTTYAAAVSNAVTAVKKSAGAAADRYQLVKTIHNWVCDQVEYQEGTWAHNSCGVFLHPSAGVVCEGYAKAVKVLCDKLGIDCILVVGNTGEAHMWNYIKMEDGNWYLLDATWDDSGYDPYRYFLLGSASASSSGALLIANRILYTNFSMAEYTQNFEYPVLSSARYETKTLVHTHSWSLIPDPTLSILPTCTTEGRYIYTCSCGQRSGERVDKLGHEYLKKKTLKNSDGSVSWVCDRGCGTVKMKMDLSFNADHIVLKKGQTTKKLKLTFNNGDTVSSCISTDPAIVEAAYHSDGACTIKAGKKLGSAQLKFTLKSGVEKSVTVTVQKKTVKTSAITGVPNTIILKKGKKYILLPELEPLTSGEKITYRSSKKSVAVVSKKGVIKARKNGSTTIKIKSGKKTVKCKVIVQ